MNEAVKNSNLEIKVYRRFINNNLKKVIEKSGLTAKQIRAKTGILEGTLSGILNFKYNPREIQKIKLAELFLIPIDDIFPEHYDEIYNRLDETSKTAIIKVDTLSLTSGEVLALPSPGDQDALDRETSQKILQKIMGEIIDLLDVRESKLLRMRFGMGEFEYPHSLDEASKEFGVTRERLRQIEAKAFERIRDHLERDERHATQVVDYIQEYMMDEKKY